MDDFHTHTHTHTRWIEHVKNTSTPNEHFHTNIHTVFPHVFFREITHFDFPNVTCLDTQHANVVI